MLLEDNDASMLKSRRAKKMYLFLKTRASARQGSPILVGK